MAFLIPLALAGSSVVGAGGLGYYIWGGSRLQPDLAKRAEVVKADLVKPEDVKKLCDEIKQEKSLNHVETKVEDHQLSRDLLLREIKTALQGSQNNTEEKKAKTEEKKATNLGSIVSTIALSKGRQLLRKINIPVKTPSENPIAKMWLDAKSKLKSVKPIAAGASVPRVAVPLVEKSANPV